MIVNEFPPFEGFRPIDDLMVFTHHCLHSFHLVHRSHDKIKNNTISMPCLEHVIRYGKPMCSFRFAMLVLPLFLVGLNMWEVVRDEGFVERDSSLMHYSDSSRILDYADPYISDDSSKIVSLVAFGKS
jgi:hypothetical protein